MENEKINYKYIVGIDIAKEKFNAALAPVGISALPENYASFFEKEFKNTTSGFGKLREWLQQCTGEGKPKVHICLEATGNYWLNLALEAHSWAMAISVVNPLAIKRFGQMKLTRSKTDPADARIIALFCDSQKPRTWNKPSKTARELQDLARHLQSLKAQNRAVKNRLGNALNAWVKKDLRAQIRYLQNHIAKTETRIFQLIKDDKDLSKKHRLLISIPGIADLSAALILAEIGDLSIYQSARQLAAHSGLTPAHRQSGKHNPQAHISKIGSSRLRAILYMPALSASRPQRNLPLANRLRSAGKPEKIIITATMRKLLHITFGVLTNQKPFNLKLC